MGLLNLMYWDVVEFLLLLGVSLDNFRLWEYYEAENERLDLHEEKCGFVGEWTWRALAIRKENASNKPPHQLQHGGLPQL